MKNKLLCLAVAFMAIVSVSAQTDLRLFNHLSVGVGVGTPGIGVDLAVPCTRFLDFQAGVSLMPGITYSTTMHTTASTYRDDTYTPFTLPSDLDKIAVRGKLNMVNGKVMVNFYPIPISSFHITAGAYFGQNSVVEVYNKVDGQLTPINEANTAIAAYNAVADANGWEPQDEIGLKLGDYLLKPDQAGNAKATLKTNNFKPYVGLGIGRAVPGKRLGFKLDLGAMFWGSPKIVDHAGVQLEDKDFGGKDGGVIRIVNKLKVCPVLNFRLCGKIF